eukprot:1710425-Prymnesium_polylepis.1
MRTADRASPKLLDDSFARSDSIARSSTLDAMSSAGSGSAATQLQSSLRSQSPFAGSVTQQAKMTQRRGSKGSMRRESLAAMRTSQQNLAISMSSAPVETLNFTRKTSVDGLPVAVRKSRLGACMLALG